MEQQAAGRIARLEAEVRRLSHRGDQDDITSSYVFWRFIGIPFLALIVVGLGALVWLAVTWVL